jgi:hypothetical protein
VRRASGGVVRGNPLALWRLALKVAQEDRRRWGGFFYVEDRYHIRVYDNEGFRSSVLNTCIAFRFDGSA